jgi:hypothetical protein
MTTLIVRQASGLSIPIAGIVPRGAGLPACALASRPPLDASEALC